MQGRHSEKNQERLRNLCIATAGLLSLCGGYAAYRHFSRASLQQSTTKPRPCVASRDNATAANDLGGTSRQHQEAETPSVSRPDTDWSTPSLNFWDNEDAGIVPSLDSVTSTSLKYSSDLPVLSPQTTSFDLFTRLKSHLMALNSKRATFEFPKHLHFSDGFVHINDLNDANQTLSRPDACTPVTPFETTHKVKVKTQKSLHSDLMQMIQFTPTEAEELLHLPQIGSSVRVHVVGPVGSVSHKSPHARNKSVSKPEHVQMTVWSVPTLDLQIRGLKFMHAVKVFDAYFGFVYPPKTRFVDWPEEYLVYYKLCEEMPHKLRDLNNIRKFREWMYNTIKSGINTLLWHKIQMRLKQDCEESIKLKQHNAVLFALLGCLHRLLLSYRWAILPLNLENLIKHSKIETTMPFPQYLLKPWQILCNFYDLPYNSNASNAFASIIDYNNQNIPKFTFSVKDQSKEYVTEITFLKTLISTEMHAKDVMLAMSACLEYFFQNYGNLSVEASRDESNAKFEQEYLKLLKKVEKEYAKGISHFGKLFHSSKVDAKVLFENNVSMMGWNLINLGGPSVSQQLFVIMMDIFVLNYKVERSDNDAENVINVGFDDSLRSMMSPVRDLVKSLIQTVKLREELLPCHKLNASIQKEMSRIVSRIRGFRITHRNKVFEAIVKADAKKNGRGNFDVTASVASDSDASDQVNQLSSNNIANEFHKHMSNIIKAVEMTRDSLF